MKRLLILLCYVLAFTGVANAVDIALLPHVPDRSSLSAKKSTAYDVLVRDDFSVGFGAPPVAYKSSNSACSLNAGAGDGGSQVPSADGKCWLASLQQPYDPRIWGVTAGPINFYVHTAIDPTPGNDASGANFCLSSLTPCLTLTQAATEASKFCVKGSTAQVNMGDGSWTESVGINQPLQCSSSALLDPIITNPSAIFGVSEIVFHGNGSANTTWNGGSCCGGTLIVSSLGIAGLEDLKITGTGNNFQSTIFAQMTGTINVFGDVEFGNATIEQVHAENAGSSITFWGPRNGDTTGKLTGGGSRFAISASGAFVHFAYGALAITGTPVFTDAFEWATAGGIIQHFAMTYTGGITGSQFRVDRNGVIENLTGTALNLLLPGSTKGTESAGGRVAPPLTVSISGSPTGLGTGGSVGGAINTGSSIRAYQVLLTTGTAATSSSGAVVVQYTDLPINSAAALQTCTATPDATGQTWGNGISILVGAKSSVNATQTFNWFNLNNGALTNLLTNSQYIVDVTCNSD